MLATGQAHAPPSPLVHAARCAGILLALLLAPLSSGDAQEADRRAITGQVVDAESGTALFGALVAIEGSDRAVLSDAEGRFSLPDVLAGAHQVMVAQLGYDTLRVNAAPGGAPLTLALTPNPVLLEGIQVVTDRFRRRRNAVASSVRAFDREQLLASAALDARDFVSRTTGLVPTSCLSSMSLTPCAWVRGRPEPVRVYIDDNPTVGGLDHLAMYQPHELYLVEVFSGGRHVRAYTNWYMSQAARGKIFPPPLIFF